MAMAKKGSGQFTLSSEIGGKPNSTSSTKPGPGEGGDRGLSKRGSGNITVDSSVKSPPTRSPGK